MTHRLATNYAKNCCNRTPIVKVIVENVVTCFFGTQCSLSVLCECNSESVRHDARLDNLPSLHHFSNLFRCLALPFLSPNIVCRISACRWKADRKAIVVPL